MTISCICIVFEKQIVLRTKRFMRVRNVRCLRSIFCVLRLPGQCTSGSRCRVYAPQLGSDKARSAQAVSSSPPFKTVRTTFMVYGLAPAVPLRDPRSVPSHFAKLHRRSPVDSLRVRWVPLVRSFHRLGAFAFSPHPGVRGSPALRLLCPFRLPRKVSDFHTALAFLLPPSLPSFLESPVFPL